jgi:hypothetical protein
VEWELTKARRFIFEGGDPADISEYVDRWLDYRNTLRGTPLEHVAGPGGVAREFVAAPSTETAAHDDQEHFFKCNRRGCRRCAALEANT